MKFLSHSENETSNFAKEIAKYIVTQENSPKNIKFKKNELFSTESSPGLSIAIHGELGAGKTVFVRAFAHQMGIVEHISSPSFTVVNEYKTKSNLPLYHLDFYRIDDEFSALAFGIEDYFNTKSAIILMEWAERIENILPENTINIFIKHIDESTREIRIGK